MRASRSPRRVRPFSAGLNDSAGERLEHALYGAGLQARVRRGLVSEGAAPDFGSPGILHPHDG
jgi:hypothetical protein